MRGIGAATCVGWILLAAACASAPGSQPTASPVPSPVPPTAPPALLPTPTEAAAAPAPELLTHSVTSPTGVLLEVPQVAHAARCLKLNVALSGIRLPAGVAPDSIATLTQQPRVHYGGEPLALTPRGGGGGGGQSPDGTWGIGQEAIYEVAGRLPGEAPLSVVVELSLDQGLGFESPLRFAVESKPDPALLCGF